MDVFTEDARSRWRHHAGKALFLQNRRVGLDEFRPRKQPWRKRNLWQQRHLCLLQFLPTTPTTSSLELVIAPCHVLVELWCSTRCYQACRKLALADLVKSSGAEANRPISQCSRSSKFCTVAKKSCSKDTGLGCFPHCDSVQPV